MDYIRTAYKTRMKLWREDGSYTEVRWFRADPKAKVYDKPHRFYSRVWNLRELWRGMGELLPWKTSYDKGNNFVPFLGVKKCGKDLLFEIGGTPGKDPIIVTDDDGWSMCCGTPKALPPGRLKVSGSAIIPFAGQLGLRLSGVGTQGLANAVQGRGGMRLGGGADQGLANGQQAKGGTLLGVRGQFRFGVRKLGEGGLLVNSTAPQGIINRMVGAGGLLLGGIADQGPVRAIQAEGGTALGGQAYQGPMPVMIGDGGLSLAGDATQYLWQGLVSDGGLSLNTGAIIRAGYVMPGDGGLSLNSGAIMLAGPTLIGDGGLALNTGGMIRAGVTLNGDGGLSLGGSATQGGVSPVALISSAPASGSSGEITVPMPAGAEPGMYLLLHLAVAYGESPLPTLPAGFTALGDTISPPDLGYVCGGLVVDGTEPTSWTIPVDNWDQSGAVTSLWGAVAQLGDAGAAEAGDGFMPLASIVVPAGSSGIGVGGLALLAQGNPGAPAGWSIADFVSDNDAAVIVYYRPYADGDLDGLTVELPSGGPWCLQVVSVVT